MKTSYGFSFGDINVFNVPIRAITTIPAADWMDVSMGLAYQHVSLVGEVSAAQGFGEGSFGRRAFDLEPLLNPQLSIATIKVHRRHIYAKLNVKSHSEIFALLINPPAPRLADAR